jgi:hypothetical protein
VVTLREGLEAFGDGLGGVERLKFVEQVERLEAPGAGFEDVVRRDRQPLGPAPRVGVIKIGDKPEAGEDLLFRALLATAEVEPVHRKRHIQIVVVAAFDEFGNVEHGLPDVADGDVIY